MNIKEERTWAGSEASLEKALEAEVKLSAASHTDDEEDEGPRLLSIADGLATISIKGPLVNSDSPYLKYFGVTGYPEIREALIAAANDSEVRQVLLDIDSGGGAVSGCADTGMLIRTLNKLKPVTAYGETMASAAYWLGCSAGKVYCGKTSLLGSIGVKATFREFSEANKQMGITVTVIRAGKYKALADSNEPLTKEAREQIQTLVNASYEQFVDHVAEMRGVSYDQCHEKMADGMEFIGQKAVDAGLADGVSTFDAVVGGIKKKILATINKSMDNQKVNSLRLSGNVTIVQPTGAANMAKKALTEADIAALASGGSLQIDAQTPATEPEQPAVAAETPAVEAAAEEAPAEKVAISDTTMQFLQSQVKEKDAALLSAGIKIAKLEEKIADMDATHSQLVQIACKSISNMAIALNGTSLVSADSSAVQVVAEHARVAALFCDKFRVGGVAAVSSEDSGSKKSKAYVMTNVQQAQINAVRG
jgi:signal peptide peptidase SppA